MTVELKILQFSHKSELIDLDLTDLQAKTMTRTGLERSSSPSAAQSR